MKPRKLKKGDRVYIKTLEQLDGVPMHWNLIMKKYCGKQVTVYAEDSDFGWCMQVRDTSGGRTSYWHFKESDIDWEKSFQTELNIENQYEIY